MTGTAERQRAERLGRTAEAVAAVFLMARGHRILARRFKTRLGEIDLIAVKRQRLAFIEVKYRQSLADCQAAVEGMTGHRVRAAADLWLQRNPRYASFDQGFDVVFVLPWQKPVYLPDAL